MITESEYEEAKRVVDEYRRGRDELRQKEKTERNEKYIGKCYINRDDDHTSYIKVIEVDGDWSSPICEVMETDHEEDDTNSFYFIKRLIGPISLPVDPDDELIEISEVEFIRKKNDTLKRFGLKYI